MSRAAGGESSAFARPGRTRHFGIGGEHVWKQGVGLGVEVGGMTRTRRRTGFRLPTVPVLSFNGSYHFLSGQSPRKLIPFVTGGYTLIFVPGGSNLGGGVNYWMRDRLGLRLAFRHHVSDGAQFWQFRIGLAFR